MADKVSLKDRTSLFLNGYCKDVLIPMDIINIIIKYLLTPFYVNNMNNLFERERIITISHNIIKFYGNEYNININTMMRLLPFLSNVLYNEDDISQLQCLKQIRILSSQHSKQSIHKIVNTFG